MTSDEELKELDRLKAHNQVLWNRWIESEKQRSILLQEVIKLQDRLIEVKQKCPK